MQFITLVIETSFESHSADSDWYSLWNPNTLQKSMIVYKEICCQEWE